MQRVQKSVFFVFCTYFRRNIYFGDVDEMKHTSVMSQPGITRLQIIYQFIHLLMNLELAGFVDIIECFNEMETKTIQKSVKSNEICVHDLKV